MTEDLRRLLTVWHALNGHTYLVKMLTGDVSPEDFLREAEKSSRDALAVARPLLEEAETTLKENPEGIPTVEREAAIHAKGYYEVAIAAHEGQLKQVVIARMALKDLDEALQVQEPAYTGHG